jgi:hypothetical protein
MEINKMQSKKIRVYEAKFVTHLSEREVEETLSQRFESLLDVSFEEEEVYSFEDIAKEYGFITNKFLEFGPEFHPYNGMMFETDGQENLYVRQHSVQNIFTLIVEDNFDVLIPGYHIVNRMGYFISAKPHNDESYVLY